jgi:asparagine synthase (glutamine-hydrolysing)
MLRREDAQAELRTHIREAVKTRLESEVPLGVFLSGGLDSSVVVAEMSDLGMRPRTFSVGFEQGALDERTYARLVADTFDTDHLELVPETDALDLFQLMVSRYDEPFADSSALATLAISRAASAHVTVVLTGDGGDELFGGYDRYRAYELAVLGHKMAGPLANGMAAVGGSVASAIGSYRGTAVASALRDPWASYRNHMFHFSPAEAQSLIRSDVRESARAEAAVERLDVAWERASEAGQRWVPWVDAQTYLPDDLLTKMDRATMAFGLESRSPLLDQALWEFVAEFPRKWLLGRRHGKIALREAYRGVLPDPILTRPKQGFGVPVADWMRTYLKQPIGDLLLAPRDPVSGLLDPTGVDKVVEGFLSGDDRLTTRTWNLLCLAGWNDLRSGGA